MLCGAAGEASLVVVSRRWPTRMASADQSREAPPRYHHAPTALAASGANVGSQSDHFPLVAPTGVGFFQFYYVANMQVVVSPHLHLVAPAGLLSE